MAITIWRHEARVRPGRRQKATEAKRAACQLTCASTRRGEPQRVIRATLSLVGDVYRAATSTSQSAFRVAMSTTALATYPNTTCMRR